MLVKSGAQNVDVVDLALPHTVESSPLDTLADGNGFSTFQNDGRSIVPGLFLFCELQHNGPGLLTLDGYPDLDLIPFNGRSDEDDLGLGGLCNLKSLGVKTNAHQDLYVSNLGAEVGSVQLYGFTCDGLAAIVGCDARDNWLRQVVGATFLTARDCSNRKYGQYNK